MEDLYLHHRDIYDRIMRKRIADLPLDLGSIVGLFFLRLHPGTTEFYGYFTDCFPAVKGGLSHIYQKLYFRPPGSFALPLNSRPRSLKLLTEFLTNPGRAGEYALDGPKCALVAKFLLDCFILPYLGRNCSRYFNIYRCSDLLSETGTLLSKASHSDELVRRINHADINCRFFASQWLQVREADEYVEARLRILIKGIGDYLTRVVGSVPIDLKITLRVETTYFLSYTLGPLYYEGQGTSNV